MHDWHCDVILSQNFLKLTVPGFKLENFALQISVLAFFILVKCLNLLDGQLFVDFRLILDTFSACAEPQRRERLFKVVLRRAASDDQRSLRIATERLLQYTC